MRTQSSQFWGCGSSCLAFCTARTGSAVGDSACIRHRSHRISCCKNCNEDDLNSCADGVHSTCTASAQREEPVSPPGRGYNSVDDGLCRHGSREPLHRETSSLHYASSCRFGNKRPDAIEYSSCILYLQNKGQRPDRRGHSHSWPANRPYRSLCKSKPSPHCSMHIAHFAASVSLSTHNSSSKHCDHIAL